MFQHKLLKGFKLERTEIDDQRYYKTPSGLFKSVTTILSEKIDKPYLKEWKERVGEEEAKRVSTKATIRGTAVHSLVEKYLSNDPKYKQGSMPSHYVMFKSIMHYFDDIDEIYGLELQLYSSILKAAGTADIIAKYKGKMSILDIKTSKRIKTLEDIEDYFYQTSAYSMMIEELYGLTIERLVIIMGIDNENSGIVIEQDASDWKQKTIELFTN
jgi:genome maintenance exonuclease 1